MLVKRNIGAGGLEVFNPSAGRSRVQAMKQFKDPGSFFVPLSRMNQPIIGHENISTR